MAAEQQLQCAECGTQDAEFYAILDGAAVCAACAMNPGVEEPRPDPGWREYLRGGVWILFASAGCLIGCTAAVWIILIVSRFLGKLV